MAHDVLRGMALGRPDCIFPHYLYCVQNLFVQDANFFQIAAAPANKH